ncbi:CLAVATA3/ESR (CLE)-related protein 25 [Humulus lupulus]|uniref:CLAVATA3/ESR (CLE)-related protein 25 n=1 Tax=Humulus lupulus TaxID=3486 RepID=UPI002B40BC07|nr:CLAVATA3/ESR (CLE)-related protein 25 [Humulus lupulus]
MDKIRREKTAAAMGSGSVSGRGKVVLRVFVGALFLLGTFWFLLVGIISNHHVHATKTVSIGSVSSSTEMLKHWKWNGRDRTSLHWDTNLIYVSKRRVPNGPDPIHNRRVVTTRQPPGRV